MFVMFHLDPEIGMLITTAIIIPYTIYGGFRSVVYTDVIQAFVMIFTLVAGPIAGIVYLSNHPDLFAQSIPLALQKSGDQYTSLVGAFNGFMAGIVVVGSFSWFFGYLGGQPQLSTRFMAIKSRKQAIKARNVGIIWTLVAYTGALMLGWIGIAIFGPDTLHDREWVMPAVILTIFPPYLAAVLITGAIAAMISTADSLLILSATELTQNILHPVMKKRGLFNNSLVTSRLVTALIAVVALILAYFSPSDLIFTIVSYVWAGIGGTFSIVILFSLFWKKYHGKAVIATIVSGVLFTVIWTSTGMDKVITARLLTFFVAGLFGLISTLLLKKTHQ